jgi:hypothetical protein
MKKLLFLLLLIPLLFGCVPLYTDSSNPQLNLNGQWIITSITPSFSGAVEDIKIVDTSYFAQTSFVIVDTIGNEILIRNDTTNINPCFFYKTGYVWEFDYNTLIIKNNTGQILREYLVSFGDMYYNPDDFTLQDKITGQAIPGNWHFSQNGNGANPANDLIISMPEISFQVQGSGRSFDRGISQNCIVTFMR